MTFQVTEPQVAESVVIGGGVAGLVVAWELARAGRAPVLLEATATAGGAVRAHRVAGLDLDAGADSFATAQPDVRTLIVDLGLQDEIVAPSPLGAWVRHGAGTAPLPAAALLGIPAHPWAADVRGVIGVPGALRASADLVAPARSLSRPGVTLGAAVRRRLGARVLDRLVEPVAGGVYAAAPDALELRAVAPRLLEAAVAARSLSRGVRMARPGGQRPGSAVAGLRGGMHRLPVALEAAIRSLGGDVCTGFEVTELVPQQREWLVRGAHGATLRAGSVVLAAPLSATAAVAELAAPGLLGVAPAAAADVRLCTLILDDSRLDAAPRGTGVLVAATVHDVQAKALTHATAKWPWLAAAAGPGRHVLRLSYGRAGDAATVKDAEPEVRALRDASALLGLALRQDDVVASATVRWPSTLNTFPPGHAEGVRRARSSLEPHGVWLVGAAVSGSGLAAVVSDARVQARALLAATRSEPGTGAWTSVGHRRASGRMET